MLTIDIKDLKEEGYYKATIIDQELHRHRNIFITNKENLINIYEKHIGFYSKENMVTDIQEITIGKQKTGFGYRSFFICSECGERRTKLYYKKGIFICRSCCGENIYKYRTNMYDEGGISIIEYKINKLLKELNLEKFKPETVPPMPIDFANCKPKYMRYKKFDLIIRQLIVLYKLKQNTEYGLAKYTTSEINYLINPNLIGDMDDLFLDIIPSTVYYDKKEGGFIRHRI